MRFLATFADFLCVLAVKVFKPRSPLTASAFAAFSNSLLTFSLHLKV
jgi:hypothetical protein